MTINYNRIYNKSSTKIYYLSKSRWLLLINIKLLIPDSKHINIILI